MDLAVARKFALTWKEKAEGTMNYLRQSLTNVLVAVIGAIAIVTVAIWQVYLFSTLRDSQGIVDLQNGAHPLWWSTSAALIACMVGFFVFSVFRAPRQGTELHVNS